MSSGFGDDQEFGFGTGLATAPSETELKPPPMYPVSYTHLTLPTKA